MNEAQFNFVFGFLVAMIMFWFIPLIWRRVMPAKMKALFPFGGKGKRKIESVEVEEPDYDDDTEVDIEIKEKRTGNYHGRPKGAKNKPKAQAIQQPPAEVRKKRDVVSDFVLPENTAPGASREQPRR